ncbi:Regulator of Vps4 activity in the MVB pathway protein [Prunus dulcis]|uniref:Regulator of Vps4 activity in the MVB pathway protein n=1 Tax=Prunus dulcis TaxID=3755 RepID=A0A4Y1S0Y5_PRUDU|nr:Regulator of Vps4 activity in the MVB pathway protein [Prunus dulcis]
MAAQGGSSSAAQAEPFVENEEELIFGAESGWVEARTFCDHLPSLSTDLAHIPAPDTPCNSDLSAWCFSCDAYLDAQVIHNCGCI